MGNLALSHILKHLGLNFDYLKPLMAKLSMGQGGGYRGGGYFLGGV